VKPTIRSRAFVFGAVLFAVALALFFARRGDQGTVPSQVREAIVKGFPGRAFVPGRLPTGYRYANWAYSKRPGLAYVLIFQHGSVKDQIDLVVGRQPCPAPPKRPAKDTHTLHVNGHELKWLQSSKGPIVWRCMTNEGRSFVITGQAGPLQKLAELVGYAVPAH
jgi:hypothetical protein